ncbi:hypothetical protein HK103_002921 [Boothiomyces macroporosus]|uniref:MCM C-terminal AAA(+) ATPase domain-containing protein n=1 Tax=Boothiomyces macroporosus TaxID=261099 RepID=A0AAD5Y4M4_9FUNG|nr:hypothetical protein HK103_002921 [Boothiomyces macroporosus]
MTEIHELKETKDYQEIRIQEQVSRLDIGTIPRTITCILMDDLVDECKAGDDVTVTSIVIERWKRIRDHDRLELEITLYANNIRVNNSNATLGLTRELQEEFENFWKSHRNTPLLARNKILASFCPQVYGLYIVKLAIMLVLVGGVGKQEGGLKIRGDSHILLVGVKDSGEWQLEAGALVLADKGICCIDEFGTIREQDKTAIHEAMEQQSISVAKAGLVCKLNTRCSIIAATNPKGKYDTRQNIEINTAIASPTISSFLLANEITEIKTTNSPHFSIQKLSSYIDYVRQKQPQLTKNATTVLKNYYQIQRQKDFRNQARTTIRLLESLIRLSQAHAKLLCQDKVLVRDAVVAISVIEASMQTTALNGLRSCFETFPDDPDLEHSRMENDVLISIGCGDLVENYQFQGNGDFNLPDLNYTNSNQPDLNYTNSNQPDLNYSDFNFVPNESIPQSMDEVDNQTTVAPQTRLNSESDIDVLANTGNKEITNNQMEERENRQSLFSKEIPPENQELELLIDDDISDDDTPVSWEATIRKEKETVKDQPEISWEEYQQSLDLDQAIESSSRNQGSVKIIEPRVLTFASPRPREGSLETNNSKSLKKDSRTKQDLAWEEYLQKAVTDTPLESTDASIEKSGLLLDLPDDPFNSDEEIDSIPCNILGSSLPLNTQTIRENPEKKRKLVEDYDFENNDLFASQVSNFGLDKFRYNKKN